MSPNSDRGPTELLRAWSQGDGSALDRLVPLVYEELHRLARRYMRQERPDHTLQATSLVNEAYLRLIDVNRVEWRDRTHFLAVAAQMMRRILVDSARNRQRQKRGGGAVQVSLVHRVAAADNLDAAVDDVVRELFGSAPGTAAAVRRLVADAAAGPGGARERVAALNAERRTGEVALEGMGAFLEKRRPSWTSDE